MEFCVVEQFTHLRLPSWRFFHD